MKKKNNGGFLLSESLIVSTFVLTVITLMFIQFKGVIVNNKKQYTYNNVEDIYSLGSFADFIRKNKVEINEDNIMIFTGGSGGSCTSNVASFQTSCTNIAKAIGAEYIFYTYSDIDRVKYLVLPDASLNQDLKDFVERINGDKVEGRKRLIAKFTNGNFATVIISDDIPIYEAQADSCALGNVTITLKAGDGSVNPSFITGLGTEIYGTKLPTPVWPGHTFNGWYYNGIKIESTDKLCESKALTAGWN